MAIQCEQGIFLLHGMIDLVIEILVITLLLIKLFLIVYCLHKHSLNVLCKDSANEWNDKRKYEVFLFHSRVQPISSIPQPY
jgi:hypothetical protein